VSLSTFPLIIGSLSSSLNPLSKHLYYAKPLYLTPLVVERRKPRRIMPSPPFSTPARAALLYPHTQKNGGGGVENAPLHTCLVKPLKILRKPSMPLSAVFNTSTYLPFTNSTLGATIACLSLLSGPPIISSLSSSLN
jgi:hypothetical protein